MAEKPGLISDERPNDEKNEEIMNEWFAETLYPALIDTGVITSFELTPDKERQVSGIDAVFTAMGLTVNIDNKTRHSMTNKECKRLAVELRTYDKYGKKRITGWGINPKETGYWLFVHILDGGTNGKTGKEADISKEDIRKAKIELIKPEEFHAWLNKKGIAPEELEEAAKQLEGPVLKALADGENVSYGDRTLYIDNFKSGDRYTAYLSVSIDIPEAPVNLVVNEFVCDHFRSSRRFIWDINDGLTEEI